MDSTRNDRDEGFLVEALKSREYNDPGPARLEFERRRLMGRLAAAEQRPLRVWRTVLVGGFAGAAAVAAAVTLMVVFGGIGEDGGDGQVTLAGTWVLEHGDAIARGTPIRIPDDDRAELVLPDGTTIWAGPGTRMSVEGEDGSRLRVESGSILARVVKHEPARRFEVLSPEATVQVLGTVFAVDVADERTVVRLHEGEVRLLCSDRTVTMQPGHQVVASASGLESMATFGPQDVVADRELSDGLAFRPTSTAVAREQSSGSPEVAETAVAVAEGILAPEDDEPGPIESAEAGEEAPAKSRRAPQRPSLRQQVVGHWNAKRYGEIVMLVDVAERDTELLHFRARALAKLRRWRESGATFALVAKDDPGRRAEALYRSADAFSRGKDFSRSLDMAHQAISMGGPNADHAWKVKIGALSGMGQYQAAAAAAGVYLDLFPSGAHVAEAQFARGTGLRLGKKWSQASQAYGSFLKVGKGSAPMRDDASFYYGYSLLKAGRADAGRTNLARYLRDYPSGRHAEQARAALGQ